MAEATAAQADTDLLTRFRGAVAEDLSILATLHEGEIDRELLISLQRIDTGELLGLCLERERSRSALDLFRAGLEQIVRQGDGRDPGPDQAAMDALAADYADIYLTHGLRAAPSESVWLDPDNLAMQGPMFACRDWYRRHGLAVPDWRQRPDDHLVHQLQFVAYLMAQEERSGSLEDAATFMDRHLLRWIEPFAERVACRSRSPFYAGLAALTAAYLDELRSLLAEVLHEPRPRGDGGAAGPEPTAPSRQTADPSHWR